MQISGFEKIISLDTFEYVLATDRHECCQFSVTVAKEHSQGLLDLVDSPCTIEHEDFSFSGTVNEVGLTTTFDHDVVRVTVLGATHAHDLEAHDRVFQREDMKLSDVVKATGLSDMQLPSDEPKIQAVVVQEGETDWAFLCRVARTLGLHVFPGKELRMGKGGETSGSVDETDLRTLDLALRKEKSELWCRTGKAKPALAQKVSLFGRDFFVDSIVYKKAREKYEYVYHLAECPQQETVPRWPTYALVARVADANDPERMGRVKLEYLEPFEDVLQDAAIWTAHASSWASKGLGIACVPLVDDVVRVMVRNGNAEVVSSIRTEAFDDRVEKPEFRYFVLGEKTHVILNDDVITLDNQKYHLEISQEVAKISFGDNVSATINEQAVIISTDKTVAELSSEAKIKTSDLQIEADGGVQISSGNVEIKGKSGVSIN